MPADPVPGGCLCGAVAFALAPPLDGVILCHCADCRRSSGHVWAHTTVPMDRFRLRRDAGLRWFAGAPGGERGFCGLCGASLFRRGPGAGLIEVAHHQLGQSATDRRAQRETGLHRTGPNHLFDLCRVHTGLSHALGRGVAQRPEVGARHARDRQVLFLGRHPVRDVDLGQRRTGRHAVQCGPNVELLHEAHRPRADHDLIALVPGHVARHREACIQGALSHLCRAKAQALLDARAHRHCAGVGTRARTARVARHQHHVHEGRFARSLEVLAGHHGVVVVQDHPAGHRVHVARLEAVSQVAGGGFAALNHTPGVRVLRSVRGAG